MLRLSYKSSTQASVGLSAHHCGKTLKTHACELANVAAQINPQHLNRNVTASVLSLPYVGKSTAIHRKTGSVVTDGDLE